MNITYSTMRHDNRQLIIKTITGKEPFVIASCYSPEVAAQICELLNEQAEKGESND